MKCNPTFDVIVDRDIVQCKKVKTFVPEMPCSSSFCAVLCRGPTQPHPHPRSLKAGLFQHVSQAAPQSMPMCNETEGTPRGPTPSPSTAVRCGSGGIGHCADEIESVSRETCLYGMRMRMRI